MPVWQKILGILGLGGSCHEAGLTLKESGLTKVGIVGSPNVDKSVIFSRRW